MCKSERLVVLEKSYVQILIPHSILNKIFFKVEYHDACSISYDNKLKFEFSRKFCVE